MGISTWTAGRASLAVGIGSAAFTLALAAVSAVLNRFSAPDVAYAIVGVFWMLAIGAHIVGAGLGIEGLRRREAMRLSLSGAALNGLSVLTWTVVIPLLLSGQG